MYLKKLLNRYFRTKANHHVIRQGWKFKFYMWFVKLTDERR